MRKALTVDNMMPHPIARKPVDITHTHARARDHLFNYKEIMNSNDHVYRF